MRSILKYFKPDLIVFYNLRRDECIQQLEMHMIKMKQIVVREETDGNGAVAMEIENS